MNEPTIAELKTDKKKLEDHITRLVRDFEVAYEVKVNLVSVHNEYPKERDFKATTDRLELKVNIFD